MNIIFCLSEPSHRYLLLAKSLGYMLISRINSNTTLQKGGVTITKVTKKSNDKKRGARPAMSLEARENQLISLAVDLAEKQLLEGTASSQVITHYLKLGTTRERIEKEILQEQKKLVSAKTEELKTSKRIETIYEEALKAMKSYSGKEGDEYDE